MGKGGAIRYASLDAAPASVRAAAARADQAARPAAPAYRPVATSSGPAANGAKASGRTRHRLGEMNGTEQSYALHLQDLVAKGAKASGRTRHRLGEMNGTEQSYALHLQDLVAKGEVLWWTFEAIRLRLADKTTLTVDFFVMRAGGALEAHELKGKDKHWEDDARVKIKVAAELYPFQFYGVHRAGGEWQYEAF